MSDGAVVIFLLSPAYCAGRRAKILLRADSPLPIAHRLRAGQLSIAEAFTFMSGLYFRGKIAYARRFGRTTNGGAAVFVITPTRGLVAPDEPVSVELLHEFASVDVNASDWRYRHPLERDVTRLATGLAGDARVVLLGSVATGKYVDVLATTLGERLHYPVTFIGRGDMSRGGLLLRSVTAAEELDYVVVDPSVQRRGPRPPKLEPLWSTGIRRED
ncbi:MAG: hypothetical protein ABI652_02865 [Acidobacteriota bacterium]